MVDGTTDPRPNTRAVVGGTLRRLLWGKDEQQLYSEQQRKYGSTVRRVIRIVGLGES